MPRRKGAETVGVAAVPSTTSARTRRARNKPPVEDKSPSPLENEAETSVKTPLTRVKKPVAGFPDRLNWKMSHLTMPTTSTPKVDLAARKVTERDVDTAFGFDDSCTGDVGANYSTLISPIAHCSTGTGGLSVWKVNPLTQRNVEIELPKPVSRTEQENVPERRSTRKKAQEPRPKSISDNNKTEIALVTSSPKPKLTEEVTAEVVTEPLSPTISEYLRETETSALYTKTKEEKLQKPSEKVDRRSTRSRTKPKVFTPEDDMPTRKVREQPKSTETLELEQSEAASTLSNEVATTSNDSTMKTTSSNSKTRSRKVALKKRSTRSKAQAVSSTAKRRKKPLFPEDTDGANGASPFSALLEKYNEDKPTSVQLEGQLHVDRRKIIRTYGSRKRVKFSEDRESEYDFIPSTNVEFHSEPEKAGPSKRKPNSKKRTKSKKEDGIDEEAEKWLEEKKKEFEDVLKVPLVIENSFSD